MFPMGMYFTGVPSMIARMAQIPSCNGKSPPFTSYFKVLMFIYRIKRSQVLPISVDTAWQFFSSPGNLPLITPPWLNLKILGSLSPHIRQGMLISYHVTPLFGLQMNWLSEITHVDAPHFFVDEQRLGPYRLWHHEHFFHACEAGVQVDDIVSYALKYEMIGALIHAIWIKKRLQAIFDFRSSALSRRFRSSPEQTAGSLSPVQSEVNNHRFQIIRK
jgi:ligand-binding SRPBCC domain-containing protein